MHVKTQVVLSFIQPPQDEPSFLCTVLILTYSVVSVYFSDYTWGLQQSLSTLVRTHTKPEEAD